MMRLAVTFSLLIVLFFSACSSENDGNQKKYYNYTTKKKGYFIDSGVSGLDYTSNGSVYKQTKSGGYYEYLYGDLLSFKVGNVALGSAYGSSTITPKDLAIYEKFSSLSGAQEIDFNDINFSLREDAVVNRAQFLLSLDSNASEVGIQISEQTRQDAQNWKDLNFSLPQGDTFKTELLNNTTINPSKIVTAEAALDHLESSLRCTYSGAYKGNWILSDGGHSGFVGILIQSDGKIVAMGDGQQVGENNNTIIYSIGEHNMDTGEYLFSNQTFYYDPQLGEVISTEPTDINGSGRSIGYDKVSGEFSQTINGELQQGVYEAYRVAKGVHTAYRFTGFGYTADNKGIGMFTIDLQSDGSVVGMIHDSRTNKQPPIAGHVDYSTGKIELEIKSEPAIIMTNLSGKTIYSDYPDINLTWQYQDGTVNGYADGVGCQLEEPDTNTTEL